MPVKRPSAKELESLRREIESHNHRYYVLDDPGVSDAEYDALLRRLEAIEDAFPDLRTADSPTQRIGAAPSESFGVVAHRVPMLSLENAMEEAELREWRERLVRVVGESDAADFVCEPKMDGVAVELVYQRGVLSQASTRGDGINGEDITANVKTIRAVPLRLRDGDGRKPPEELSVRGEVYIPLADFDQINRRQMESAGKVYANPRNTTAHTGLLNVHARLLGDAERDVKEGNLDSAASNLAAARSVSPSHPETARVENFYREKAAEQQEQQRQDQARIGEAWNHLETVDEVLGQQPMSLFIVDLATRRYDQAARLAPQLPELKEFRARIQNAYSAAVSASLMANKVNEAMAAIEHARRRNWITPQLLQQETAIRQQQAQQGR